MNILKKDQALRPGEYLSNMFNQFLHNIEDEFNNTSLWNTALWNPAVDITENENNYLVCADLPGVNQKDLHVFLENNALIIKGIRRYQQNEKKQGFSRTERMQGEFYRRFLLPEVTNESQIQAKYSNGVLEITIPKKSAPKSKEIEIRVEK